MRLLRFTAAWCGPCKRVGPLIDGMAARHGVPVDVVDVDDHPELPARYGVQAVPAVVLLHGSDPVFSGSGAAALTGLSGALEAL